MGVPNTAVEVSALNTLLKATALQAFARTEVAYLHGREWMEFLDKTAPGTNFSTKGEILAFAGYKSEVHSVIEKEEVEELLDMINLWIKKHHHIK